MHFTSAVQAVACALEIQKQLPAVEGQVPLQHRIGIHLGDVHLEDGDVMGDGVNIAARLQTQADPGGICISKTVYDVVKNRLAIQATFLGPRELKNITEAVPIYKILIEAQVGAGAVAPPSRPVRPAAQFNWVLPVVAAVVLFLLLVLGVVFGIRLGSHLAKAGAVAASAPATSSAAPAPAAAPAPQPLSPEATRFVGAWQNPFHHTITVFYPDGRYGIDLTIGDHQIIGIVGNWQADANSITLVRTDPAKTTVLRLLSITDSQLIAQSDTGNRFMERIPMPTYPTSVITGLSAAGTKDPNRPRINRMLGFMPFAQSFNLGVDAYNDGDYDQAITRFTEALALKPGFDLALLRRAESYNLNNDTDHALADYAQLIGKNPRDAVALTNRAFIYIKVGNFQAALDDANNALSIRPNYVNALDARGCAYLLLGQYPQAINDLNAALTINPTYVIALVDRGVAKKASGDVTGGQADLDQALSLQAAPAPTAEPTAATP